MGSQAPLGKKQLFNTPGAELPGYVREIAREVMKQGKSKSQAIQIAIGMIKRWAAGGDGVKPETVAKAQAALAQWEKAKATARATPNKGSADLSNPSEDAEKGGHCMIALEVPDGTVPGKDDLHLTLAYLGADVSDRDFAGAVSRALTAAQEVGPVTGSVGGLGVFPPKDGNVAVWATVDAPGLSRLRDYVQTPRRRDGGEEHGFTPHITVDWVKEGAKLPVPLPKTPVTFTHLIVKRGSQQFRFQLGGEYREWSNPLAASGRQVLLAQAPEPKKTARKESGKQAEKRKEEGKLPPGASGWKHGWIPVDENGKAVGPSQKPAWLKAAEAKHKAAGGRTAEEIQKEKAAGEFKARAEKAAAPAKKAAAEAERTAKKSAAAKEKATNEAKRTAAKKTADAERAEKAKTREGEKKTRERDALVNRAYKQALADRKAGRELSEQQRRVVAHVEAKQKKDTRRLRRVDVKGADGSSVAKKTTLPAKRPATGATTTAVRAKAPAVVARSWTSGQQQRNKSKRKGGQVTLANILAPWDEGGGVNVVDLAGRANPLGQLAFRYKHGWILINPAIPSRGRGGGGLARKHGHKSGTVTHGHFEPGAGGKGKKFVPERTGGKTAAQKVAELKMKQGVNDPSKYTTAAAQKDSGDALKPSVPSPEKVDAVSKAASDASFQANKTKSLADAQVAAKKHADAFVQAKKAGDLKKAEMHKTLAQSWAKKSQQIKQAEKASSDAKKKYEAEQKAKAEAEKAQAEKAEAEAKAKKVAAQKKAAELIQDAYGLGQIADKMPETSVPALNAKAQQHQHAADKYDEAVKHMEENGLPVGLPLKTQTAAQKQKSADLKKKAEEKKKQIAEAQQLSTDAYDLSDDASESQTPEDYKAAAVAHWKAAEKYAEIEGMEGDSAMHDNKADELNDAYQKAKKAEAALKKATAQPDEVDDLEDLDAPPADSLHTKVNSVISDLPEDFPGDEIGWSDYLTLAAQYKADQSAGTLPKLTAAHKKLKADGVTSEQFQTANKMLSDKLSSKTPPKKKTVAQKKAASKKVITSDGIKEKKVITADPVTPESIAAKKAKLIQDFKNETSPLKKAALKNLALKMGATESELGLTDSNAGAGSGENDTLSPAEAKKWEISLPGPGMYKDGNAIMKLMNKPTSNPAQNKAKKAAVDKALADFKSKHGKTFDPNSVEIDYSTPYEPVPQLSNEFFDEAKALGYTHISGSQDATNGWKPPAHTKAALLGYTGEGSASYVPINGQLRTVSNHGEPVKQTAAITQRIKLIDEAFADAPGLPQDTVAVRKMKTNGQFPAYPPPMKEGDEHVDYGYGSTSKSTSAWSGKVVMEVRIPKGTKVIDVNHNGVVSCSTSEQEILLPRGARYRVIKDEMIGGQRRITTEVVGVGETHPKVKI